MEPTDYTSGAPSAVDEAGRYWLGALPLDADVRAAEGGGWSVRLPVRAEHVELTRRTVVADRVLLRQRRRIEVRAADGTDGPAAPPVTRRTRARGDEPPGSWIDPRSSRP